MYQKNTTLVIIAITIFLSSCEKDKAEAPSLPPAFISIKAVYPEDYFKIPTTPKQKEVVDLMPQIMKEKERQRQIEQTKKVEKQIEQKKQKEKEEQERQEKKENYIITRSNLISHLRRVEGADILTTQSSLIEKVIPPPPPKWKLSDKDFQAPDVESSYPVDRSFILTEDRNINVVLLDSINTQIPGTIRAYASEDIFGADGRYLLIEKGDVFLGKYKSLSSLGDSRVEVNFYRIIRSDGAEIYADGESFAYASDKMGRTGLIGEVDNRNWERYGSALMVAGIGGLAGVAKSEAEGDSFEEFWNGMGDSLSDVTTKVLEENMDLAPIITVAQGEPFIIRLKADLKLKRPQKIGE